jgi:polyribonucleotide nucleotidyltransferase
VEIREIDDRGKLSLVPVEVIEREAAGEDLGGGESEDRPGIRADRSGGDRPQRDRGEGGGGDRDRRPRQRSRGGHRD